MSLHHAFEPAPTVRKLAVSVASLLETSRFQNSIVQIPDKSLVMFRYEWVNEFEQLADEIRDNHATQIREIAQREGVKITKAKSSKITGDIGHRLAVVFLGAGSRLRTDDTIVIVLPLLLPKNASEEPLPLARKEIQEAVKDLQASRGVDHHLQLQSVDEANCNEIKINPHASVIVVPDNVKFSISPPAPFLLLSFPTVPESGESGDESSIERGGGYGS